MAAQKPTILLVTLGFFVLISLVTARTNNIVIDHTSCPTETTPTDSGSLPIAPAGHISLVEDCLTLTQYAQSPAIYTTITNITLIFEPGDHTLDSRLQIQNLVNLVLRVAPTNTSNSLVAMVTCTNSAGFEFSTVSEVSVSGLEFRGCRENSVRWIDQLRMEDCKFKNGHGMELRNVRSATFKRSSFISLTSESLGHNPSGGAIVAKSSNNISVTQCLFNGNTAEIGLNLIYGNGGAIWTDSGSISICDSNFRGNFASYGGAIWTDSGNISVTECIFERNYAVDYTFSDGNNGNGGAIRTQSGSISIHDSNFSSNTAGGWGGAIWTEGGSISVYGSDFSSNNAGYGGAIRTGSGNIGVSHCLFQENSAVAYSIFLGPLGIGGAIVTVSGSITIHGSSFSRNRADGGDGGAIQTSSNSRVSIISITASDFKNNTADNGGAIWTGIGSISIHGSNFSYNTADTDGGALWAGNSININGSAFIGNSANSLGGAIRTIRGDIDIHSACDFSYNRAYRDGGAVLTDSGTITINGSSFYNNTVATDGGAIWTRNGNISIHESNLQNNTAERDGGAIWTDSGNIDTQESVFSSNTAHIDGGAIGTDGGSIEMHHTEFSINTANTDGGAIWTDSGSISIDSQCDFSSNTANTDGGVIWTARGNINIEESVFTNNTASSGGVLRTDSGSIRINGSVFIRNTALNDGGVLFLGSATDSVNEINNSIFNHNHAASQGGAIHVQYRTISFNGVIQMTNNSATTGVVYALLSTLKFSGNTTVLDNKASIYAIESKISLNGHTSIESNSHINDTSLIEEGGAITASQQSEITFSGTVYIFNNVVINGHGGAILLHGSSIYTYGNTTIAHNIALSGAGIHAYQSNLNFNGTTIISENIATMKGGGIYATSGSAVRLAGGRLEISENRAEEGGGICLETHSRLRVKRQMSFSHDCINQSLVSSFGIYFTNNSAAYGGALFISDESSTCDNQPFSRECFLQEIVSHIQDDDLTIVQNTFFEGNFANVSGGAIFGGLLDRCMVSPQAQEQYQTGSNLDAISFLTNITNLEESEFSSEISSETVGLCFCDKSGQPDCAEPTSPYTVTPRKGETIRISLVAVDHVRNPVPSSVRATVSQKGDLLKGQDIQNTTSNCTELIFTITSVSDWEELVLDGGGPCKNRKTVNVTFAPCVCPAGFATTDQNNNCSCKCDPCIYPEYIDGCSPSNSSVMRKDNIWINYRNKSDNESYNLIKFYPNANQNETQCPYLTYPHCPFDYCHPSSSPVWINLNTSNGSDAQCAFNRSGKLCGSCKDGLSLSLGSSHCLSCSNIWLALLIVFAIAGVALVAFLLVFNLTVAVGTINGLIFYANILTTNRATFFPFQSPNFFTIFIAWLNLDFGFVTCFFDGMDSCVKEWLQLAFPIYIIFLVTMVIIGCEYSTRIAKIFVGTNPVATLATLILLSYTKSLRVIIAAFSSATLKNLDGSQEIVWLIDGNVYFLKGKHIPLFLIALLILLVGIVYTSFLFSYQWLLRCPNRTVKLIKNARFYPFMDAYLAPYNVNHRYWTGLLLFIRAFLYVIAALNVSGDPGNNLLSIIYTLVSLLILRILLPGRVYKSWPLDALELSFIFNLVVFSAGSLYILEAGTGNQEALAYTSTSIAFITFLVISIYHIYAFVLTRKSRTKLNSFKLKMKLRLTKKEPTDHEIILVPRPVVTYSVVDPPATQTTILEPEQTSHENISTNKHLKIRKSLKRLFDETRMDKIEQQKGTGYTELETRSSEFSDIPYIRDSDELGMERETELNDFIEVAD